MVIEDYTKLGTWPRQRRHIELFSKDSRLTKLRFHHTNGVHHERVQITDKPQ